MAATKKSPSEKTDETPRRDTFTVSHYEAKVLETLQSIDASLKAIVAVIPKPQTVIPGLTPLPVMSLPRDGDRKIVEGREFVYEKRGNDRSWFLVDPRDA